MKPNCPSASEQKVRESNTLKVNWRDGIQINLYSIQQHWVYDPAESESSLSLFILPSRAVQHLLSLSLLAGQLEDPDIIIFILLDIHPEPKHILNWKLVCQ